MLNSLSSQSLQIVEEARIGLGDAGRVIDHDAGDLQADQRQAHRHAMIVVGFDDRAAQRSRMNDQPVGEFLDARADAAQASANSSTPAPMRRSSVARAVRRS